MALDRGVGWVEFRGVRDDARRDMVKVWASAAASLALAAVLFPWVRNLGLGLAEVTTGKQTNGMVETVAEWCQRGGAGWYFSVSWVVAAALLVLPVVAWLDLGPGRGIRPSPWSVKLPGGGRANDGQPLEIRWRGWRGGVKGVVVAVAAVVLLGWVLVRGGSFVWREWGAGTAGGMAAVLPWVVAGVVLQEVLFRGVVLGLFMRAIRAPVAILLAAAFYALMAFMVLPGEVPVADPESRMAGLAVLVARCRDMAVPGQVAAGFLPWLVLGCVLGFARWRTRALWLPVGLHAGWLVGSGLLLAVTSPLNQADPVSALLTGALWRHGFIPMAMLAIAGIVLHFITPAPRDEYEWL